MKPSALITLIVVLLALISGAVFYFKDTDAPLLYLTPDKGPVSKKRPLKLEVKDSASGLKDLEVSILQEGKTYPVFSRSYAPGTFSESVDISLKTAGIKDGDFEIRVAANDHSVYHFGAGNRREQSFFLNYDSKAPVISVLSKTHNFNRGGAGLVVYSLSEDVARTGVIVGDFFFPGYRQESGLYSALLSFPFDMKSADFIPQLIAEDIAGNERKTGFYYHTNHRSFRQRRIEVSDRFLEMKIPEFEDLAPHAENPLEAFLQVNRDVRNKNRKALKDFSLQTSPTPFWDGAFLRQRNAATLALFGDARSYYHNGKKIDNQTHLGIDLASVAQAPIASSNAGRVIFADYMGIYGLCVIVDHGLGLQTLYGHMSRLDVSAGEQVEKGQIIGRTGATGMAGGDHLHFGVIVSGVPVNPVEWWDGSWLKNNITGKLEIQPSSFGN